MLLIFNPRAPVPQVIFLILGVISISASLVFTYTGKAWVRFYGRVYRAKEPKMVLVGDHA
jgi:hypothetical protein